MNRVFSIGAAILLISCAAFALSACGGSGGAKPPCAPTLGGICLAYSSVGGTVSGLAGSGLVLSDGESLAISANGPFTFPTRLAGVGTYDVWISVQPVNPSQTCVVTNGYGYLTGNDITDISVVCTTGAANARLTGTYQVDSFGYPNDQDSDLWTLTFDGAGNFTGSNLNLDGTTGSTTTSGTYSVAADGTLTIAWYDPTYGGTTISGDLGASGDTLVAIRTPFFSSSVLFGIKQAQSNFSNASLNGAYTAARYDHNGAGDSSNLLTLTFDGAGNFTGTDTLNSNGTTSSTAVSGTYSVAADGTLTMSTINGSVVAGELSDGADRLVGRQGNTGDLPELLVGIKQGQANLSSASLTGTFTWISYENNAEHTGLAKNDFVNRLTVTFDGAGNFSGTGVQYSVESASSTTISGTYSVTPDGTLAITSTDSSTITGALSADGRTLVASQTTPGRPPTVIFAVRP